MGAFIVAAVAAAAILLIFFGISAGRGSGVSSRLERYASARKGDAAAKKTGDGPVSDFLANSPAAGLVQQARGASATSAPTWPASWRAPTSS